MASSLRVVVGDRGQGRYNPQAGWTSSLSGDSVGHSLRWHDKVLRGVAVGSEGRRPDTQAELANERTYLAWLRTGLALVAAGVAAERVLPAEGIIWARQLIGVTLILAGVVTAALARPRWRNVDRALRAGNPIPHPILGYMVAAVVVVTGLAAIVLLLRADTGH
jgi:inner membrane protein YidH